jgi:uncharacterized protein (DUF305 family)
MSTSSEGARHNRSNVAWFIGGIVLGAIPIAVFFTFNTKGISIWKFDPTFWHSDRIELPQEEVARPDKQFLELLIPYEKNLLAVAQKATQAPHSAQVQELAKSVIETQAKIQIQIKQSDREKTAAGQYALLKGDQIDDLETLYQNWYGVKLEPNRQGTSLVERASNSQLEHNVDDFDREAIRQMIRHERMAIKLAYLVLDNAQSPAIRDLAQQIIKLQGSEVNMLHNALADFHAAPRNAVTPLKPVSNSKKMPSSPAK